MKEKSKKTIFTIWIIAAIIIACFAIWIVSVNEEEKIDFEKNKVTTVGILTKKQGGGFGGSMMHFDYAVNGRKVTNVDNENYAVMDFLQYKKCIIEYHKEYPFIWSKITRLLLFGDSVMAIKDNTIKKLKEGKKMCADNKKLYDFLYLFSEKQGKTVEESMKGLNMDHYRPKFSKIEPRFDEKNKLMNVIFYWKFKWWDRDDIEKVIIQRKVPLGSFHDISGLIDFKKHSMFIDRKIPPTEKYFTYDSTDIYLHYRIMKSYPNCTKFYSKPDSVLFIRKNFNIPNIDSESKD